MEGLAPYGDEIEDALELVDVLELRARQHRRRSLDQSGRAAPDASATSAEIASSYLIVAPEDKQRWGLKLFARKVVGKASP